VDTQIIFRGGISLMPKVKNCKAKNVNITGEEIVYKGTLSSIIDIFPMVKVKHWTETTLNGKSKRNFISEIDIPKDLTLRTRNVASNGAITGISISLSKKDSKKYGLEPGVYYFNA
jgi:hypothetical protein